MAAAAFCRAAPITWACPPMLKTAGVTPPSFLANSCKNMDCVQPMPARRKTKKALRSDRIAEEIFYGEYEFKRKGCAGDGGWQRSGRGDGPRFCPHGLRGRLY